MAPSIFEQPVQLAYIILTGGHRKSLSRNASRFRNVLASCEFVVSLNKRIAVLRTISPPLSRTKEMICFPHNHSWNSFQKHSSLRHEVYRAEPKTGICAISTLGDIDRFYLPALLPLLSPGYAPLVRSAIHLGLIVPVGNSRLRWVVGPVLGHPLHHPVFFAIYYLSVAEWMKKTVPLDAFPPTPTFRVASSPPFSAAVHATVAPHFEYTTVDVSTADVGDAVACASPVNACMAC